MKTRRGISPFLATIILVVITLMIGGLLYTQFTNIIVSQVKDPSMELTGMNVSPNGETMVLSIKNDGNVPINVSALAVTYGSDHNTFTFRSSNATVISSPSGGGMMQPGDTLTVQVTTKFAIPAFGEFTVTVIGDQLSRAFNEQA
ncbi:MAG: hypothetical protein ABSF83_02115 [Nitrososphaerales archaeon]|jgi:flagellin-like protein